MTAETTSARDRLTRARLAFRRWRRSRPFWGGLLLLLSGALIFYSGNLDLGNLQIHLGLPGFQSYIIPLVLALCGLLGWFTPDQRIFYGVIGLLAAVYSLVGANLGGFVVGFVVGVFGGGLTVAWVPQKRSAKPVADDTTAELDDVQESQGLDVIDDRDDDDTPAAGVGGSPLHDTLPTSTQSPLVPAQARHADPDDADLDQPGADDETEEGKQGARFPRPRHAADESGVTGEANRVITRFRWSPRAALAVIAAMVVASIGLVTLPTPTPASAETCAPPALSKLLDDAAKNKVATKPGAKTTSKSTKSTKRSSKSAGANGFAGFASVPADNGPLDPVVDLLHTLLPGADADTTADPTPTAEPTATPTPTPTPTTEPTTPAPSAKPTSKPTDAPTAKPAPTGHTRVPVTPSPSPSTICAVTKFLTASKGQPNINKVPSKMTAAVLTMSGLSFDGVVDLPTGSGSMKVLQFSMDSSTSTPFELQPASSNGKLDLTSSKLTVSSNVKFYCTEIKGNLLGTLPVDFTVDAPPPLVVPELFFTDVTIQLAFVYADTLTADNLNIKVS